MKILITLLSRFSVITLLSAFATSSAYATGGTITFSLNATAVPTLSGTMLVILSLLLFAVAFRIAKQKNSNAGKFFMTLLGVTAIASGSGGIKLISDTNAGVIIPMPILLPATPGETTLTPNQYYEFTNNTRPPSPLNVSVQADEGSTCGTFGPTVGQVCSSGNILESGATCHIECRAIGGPD